MTYLEFEASAEARRPLPETTPTPLLALWHDGAGDWAGDWDRAHALLQDVESPDAAWVHAYLHRKEGDVANARYWYRRAGRPEAHGDLRDEWRAIARALIDASSGPRNTI